MDSNNIREIIENFIQIPVSAVNKTLFFKSRRKTSQNTFNSDSTVNYYGYTTRVVSKEEIASMPVLQLSEDNCNVFNKKTYDINAGGWIENPRQARDGVTFFGKKQQSYIKGEEFLFRPYEDLNKCDISLNYDEVKYSKHSYPYLFLIFYKKETKKYYIKGYLNNLTDNSFLFIKLCNKYKHKIKDTEIINFGMFFIQLIPIGTGIEIINLTSNNNSKYFYNKEKKRITLGRDSLCDIVFDQGKGLSRKQCTIEFDEKMELWIVSDGGKKESVNGTWLLCLRSFPIFDEMIFEIVGSKIKCKFTLNQ